MNRAWDVDPGMSSRFDRVTLASPLEGTLFEGVVARAHAKGDALNYVSGPEYRDIAELDRIVAQLPGLKVVAAPEAPVGHPEDLLKNAAENRVIGEVISARRDDSEVVAKIMITDDDTLNAIRLGTKELSLGYESNLDGDRYQRDVQLDHLSVVGRGRCTGPGGRCALQVDEHLTAAARHNIPSHLFADPAHEGLPIEDETHVRAAMSRFGQEQFSSSDAKRAGYHHILARAKTLGIDSAGFEKEWSGRLDDAHADCSCTKLANPGNADHPGNDMADMPTETKPNLDDVQAKLDQAQADLTTAQKKIDALESERDEAQRDAKAAQKQVETLKTEAAEAKTRADEAEKAATTRRDAAQQTEFDEQVNARVELVGAAKEVLGETFDAKMSDREIKIAIVKHVDGDDLDEKKSADYVQSAFDGAMRRRDAAGASRAAVREAVQQKRDEGAVTVEKTPAEREAEARQRAAARAAEAWKRPSN